MKSCLLSKFPASRWIVSWTFEWYDKPSDMVVKRHLNLNWADPTVYRMDKEKARSLWQTLIEDGYVASPITDVLGNPTIPLE